MRPDSSHQNLKYRPEIDGLRALAVLPVILFHAGFDAFKGGFVGVDVFFVISGYLITSIIANDCRFGRFSLISFYERRARRILPALFVVTVACLPFAWMWMLPVETLSFTRSELATLTFVPNVYFWWKTSYFGAAAEKLPLLHTWSLGVEEQFYLIFPLLVFFTWRFGLRLVVIAVIALGCASFGLSEWAWRAGKFSASFFLVPTRAWELMLGALVALGTQRVPIYDRVGVRLSNVGSLVGVGMLAYAVFWFDKSTPTPSMYALIPTVGTCLVIACAGPGTLVRRGLSFAPIVGVGLVSYSAYLWHQPLFAFARLRTTDEPSSQLLGALVVLSLVLAYLTWLFVESPFRRASVVSRASLVRSLLAFWVGLVAIGLFSEQTDGFSARIAPENVSLAALADSEAQGRYVMARFASLDRDFSSAHGAMKVLVIGDSFAQDFVNAVFESGSLDKAEVRTFYVSPACQIFFGTRDVSEFVERDARPGCFHVRTSPTLFRRVAEADVLIFAASWLQWAAEGLPETLQQLGLTAKNRVFVVGPKRLGNINVRELLRQPHDLRVQEHQPVATKVGDLERTLSRVSPAGAYVSMQAAVCGTGSECRLFSPEGALLSADGVHLTKQGASFAGRNLFAVQPLASLQANFP